MRMSAGYRDYRGYSRDLEVYAKWLGYDRVRRHGLQSSGGKLV